MHTSCECHPSQKTDRSASLDPLTLKINHTIRTIQDNFLSPYKVLYLLEPSQADHFKGRNQSKGCCTSNHITIPDSQLTKTQKLLKELISTSNLKKHLDLILQQCSQRHANILAGGRKDKLQINDQVDKFVVDKVIAECTNQLVFKQLTQRIAQQSASITKQIGLWATPATWKHKYPHIALDFIPSQSIAQLTHQAWTQVLAFVGETQNLAREAQLLQKDGKFEERPWTAPTTTPNNIAFKVLSNPQRFADMLDSQGKHWFPRVRQATISISALPFQLNAKANLFCTVSSNIHLCYASAPFQSGRQCDPLKFTAILGIEGELDMTIQQQRVVVKPGDLIILDSSRCTYQLKSTNKQLIVLRSFIDVAQTCK